MIPSLDRRICFRSNGSPVTKKLKSVRQKIEKIFDHHHHQQPEPSRRMSEIVLLLLLSNDRSARAFCLKSLGAICIRLFLYFLLSTHILFDMARATDKEWKRRNVLPIPLTSQQFVTIKIDMNENEKSDEWNRDGVNANWNPKRNMIWPLALSLSFLLIFLSLQNHISFEVKWGFRSFYVLMELLGFYCEM